MRSSKFASRAFFSRGTSSQTCVFDYVLSIALRFVFILVIDIRFSGHSNDHLLVYEVFPRDLTLKLGEVMLMIRYEELREFTLTSSICD
uniref:Secreted protein n=1 Tax=Panagrellus redivivus TaxID=6233 RepID=A0A7E4VSU2_PANRE